MCLLNFSVESKVILRYLTEFVQVMFWLLMMMGLMLLSFIFPNRIATVFLFIVADFLAFEPDVIKSI